MRRLLFSGSNTFGAVAWWGGNSGDTLHPVKNKLPNELDIHDISGNVWERCQDWYSSYSPVPVTDTIDRSFGYYCEVHGGSLDSYASDCRVTNRDRVIYYSFLSDGGLRLAQ